MDQNASNQPPVLHPRSPLLRYPWLTFLLPFVVYMLVGSFEPAPPKPPIPLPDGTSRPAISHNWFGLEYRQYPLVYTAKIALTIAAMLFVLPGYRQFPIRISLLALVVGVVGVVLWIGLCHLQLERKTLEPLGLAKLLGLGERPAFNPLAELADTPAWAYTFLAIRFVGLALIVPVIEEFFLRGFLMRYVVNENFTERPVRPTDAPRGHRRHCRPDADAPRRTAGRPGLVRPHYLAHDPHPQHLGLRRRPRRYKLAARHLRRHSTPMAVVVDAESTWWVACSPAAAGEYISGGIMPTVQRGEGIPPIISLATDHNCSVGSHPMSPAFPAHNLAKCCMIS